MFKFLTSLLYLSSTSQLNEEKSNAVTEEDLDLLCTLVDMKDGGPTWIQMMERSTPTMNYQGWCRDPEVRFFLISCFLWPIISPKPESAEGKTFSQLLASRELFLISNTKLREFGQAVLLWQSAFLTALNQ